MHHLLSFVALLGLFAFPLSAFAQDLALKRVMLSSGGLGYFEYEATVDGDATLRLTVSLEQVDDVLKSLVVYDDKGGVGGLSLPGREPLAQAFKDLPFDQDSLASPADLLSTLKGAQVTVGGARAITGRIVSVQRETVALPDGKATTERTRVTLLTDRGLQQFILEDAENLQFADAALREKVGQRAARHPDQPRQGCAHHRAVGARAGPAHGARGLHRRGAGVEGVLPPDPGGRSRGGALGAAGLGDGREPERPGLEGRRPDARLGPSRRLPSGALRGLLRQAARGADRGRGPADARRRSRRRRRAGPHEGGTATAAASRAGALSPAAGARCGCRDDGAAAGRRGRRRPVRGDRCGDPGRLPLSAQRERRQRPHALDPHHRPPDAGAAAGALPGRDRAPKSAGGDPHHQRRRQRPAGRPDHALRARQGGLRRLCRRRAAVGLPGRRDAAAGLCARREDRDRARRRADRPHRHGHDRPGRAAPVARRAPDRDLSRKRSGQGAAPARDRAAPPAGLDPGQARAQRASS